MIEKSGVHLCLFISCQCLEVGGGCSVGTTTSSSGGCNQGWIADGYCDDINNNVDCTYDGGDCCGSNVNTQYCTECLCLEGGGGSGGGTTPSGTTGSKFQCKREQNQTMKLPKILQNGLKDFLKKHTLAIINKKVKNTSEKESIV